MSKQMAKVFRRAKAVVHPAGDNCAKPYCTIGCCGAISWAAKWGGSAEKTFFKSLFDPSGARATYWWAQNCDDKEGYTARIIALELAALIAEETP